MTPSAGLAVPDSHLQRPYDQLSTQMCRHRPADHPPAEHVEHDGQIQKAFLHGGHIRDVRDPELVRLCRHELGLRQVGGGLRLGIALGRMKRGGADDTPSDLPAASSARLA